jgi:hypothetical protein
VQERHLEVRAPGKSFPDRKRQFTAAGPTTDHGKVERSRILLQTFLKVIKPLEEFSDWPKWEPPLELLGAGRRTRE